MNEKLIISLDIEGKRLRYIYTPFINFTKFENGGVFNVFFCTLSFVFE